MLRRWLYTLLFAGLILLALFPLESHAAGKPNVVLITLNSIRADRVGFLGAKTKTTPNLDGVAVQSVVFEQAYSQAPLTVVSHATILSGTYPQTHRASELGSRLATSLPFIPDLLRARGYRTTAFVGSAALDPTSGMAQGFERGFSVYDIERHSSAPAAQVVARAAAWLSHSAQGPFFLWVQLRLDNPQTALAVSYNAGVAATDAGLKKLIVALRASKLYDDALIVIASDHGESLGAHGEEGHGVFLYDETIHVPLLVKLPQNQNAGKRVRARASLVDIAPTILEVAGVAVPSQMQGQSLLRIAKSNSDQPAYSVSDFPGRLLGGARWSRGEPANICIFGRPSRTVRSGRRSGRHSQPGAELQSHTGNDGRATRSISTGASAARATRAGLNSRRVKCRSWLPWGMLDCRNQRLPRRWPPAASIQRTESPRPTRFCQRSACWMRKARKRHRRPSTGDGRGLEDVPGAVCDGSSACPAGEISTSH